MNRIRNKLMSKYTYLTLPHKIDIITLKSKMGSDYGGYYICHNELNSDSIIYSFGVGEDISFDLDVINTFGSNVYAFDPTPKSIAWINNLKILPEEFHFFPYGVADYNGVANFNPPENPLYVSHTMLDKPSTSSKAVEGKVYNVQSIMKMLGHVSVDVIKMDIEGAEYAVLNDIISSGVFVKQLMIEFHHRFDNVGVKATKNACALLRKNGYEIFYVSPSLEEYSFVLTNTKKVG